MRKRRPRLDQRSVGQWTDTNWRKMDGSVFMRISQDQDGLRSLGTPSHFSGQR